MRRARRMSLAVLPLLLAACNASATPADFVEVPGLGETRIDVPRPTTEGDACTVAIPETDTTLDRVAALRAIGLYADRSESDADLAASIETSIVEFWGEMPSRPQSAELLIAESDRDRVWWRDLETDVGEGGDVYVATIEEWASISVGAFTPASITEQWASQSGPVTVRFSHNGVDAELAPEYLEDWIDPGILGAINELIAPSGRRFTLFQAFDQNRRRIPVHGCSVAAVGHNSPYRK